MAFALIDDQFRRDIKRLERVPKLEADWSRPSYPTGQLTPGATITLAVPGGSVQTSDATLSYLIDPEEFFIQPQKRYLLVLSYHSEGAFYTLTKNWGLSNGIVTANSKLEQMRVAKGKSSLAGLPETQLATSLQPMLAPIY